MNPEVLRLSASAGSGKTYELARRYLALLDRVCTDAGHRTMSGCTGFAGESGGVGSLLAITFTNKAAAEMKERILLFLKRIAFGDMPEPERQSRFRFLDRARAHQLLCLLIRDFSRFHVKTIDSFMTSILKAFAVDADLSPDFRLSLTSDDLYRLAVEDLLSSGYDALQQLEDLVMREISRKGGTMVKGFDAERIVRRAVDRLHRHRDTINPEQITGVGSAVDVLSRELAAKAEALVRKMVAVDTGKSWHGGRFKGLAVLPGIEKGKYPPWMQDGRSVESLKLKDAEIPGLDELETMLNAVQELWSRLSIEKAIAELQSGIHVYRRVRRREDDLVRQLSRFEIRDMASRIHTLLSQWEASAAFCRLGERYQHYLVDEFQDTSRAQWNALAPLVINSLSEGGSLFLVGDVKQAIYGWRGGDFRLFSDVLLRTDDSRRPADVMAVCDPVPAENVRQDKLASNFRSMAEIVGFNNRLFATLALPGVPVNYGLETLQEVFADVKQKTDGGDGGLVRIRELVSDDDPDHRKHHVRTVVENAVQRHGAGGILILARVSDQVREIAGWLREWERPFVTEESLRLFANPTVKGLLNLLSYLILPDGEMYLWGVIEMGWFGLLDEAETSILTDVPGGSTSTGERDRESWKDRFARLLPDRFDALMAPLDRIRSDGSVHEQLSELIRAYGLMNGSDRVYLDRFRELVLQLELEGAADPPRLVESLYDRMGETALTMPVHHGAIRVMTIHKAKGLEAPVVILPFVDWALNRKRTTVLGQVGENPVQYLEMNETLAQADPGLASIFERYRTRETVENINMLYVAMTRARLELHICCEPDDTDNDVNHILHYMLNCAGYELTDGELALGQPEAGDPVIPDEPVADNWFLRRAADLLVIRDRPELPVSDWTARFRGTLLHEALRRIQSLPADENAVLDDIAADALCKASARLGVAGGIVDQQQLRKRLSACLEQLRPWLTVPARSWTEKEFIGAGGEVIRVDRLVFHDDQWTVMDYKTGQPDAQHERQIRRYQRILKSIGISAKPMLVYLDSGEVRHV